MAKKSKFIKNLLTTASAVAVLAGGASSALGFYRPQADALNINAGGNDWSLTGPTPNQVFATDSAIINARTDAAAGAGNMTAGAGGPKNILAINMYGYNAQLTVSNGPTRLGSVYNDVSAEAQADSAAVNAANAGNGGVANPELTLIVDDGQTVRLDGRGQALGANQHAAPENDYTALGNVTLGSGAAGTAVVLVQAEDANATLSFTNIFDGNGNDRGTIQVKTSAEFSGVIGGAQNLKAIEIYDNKSATFDANVTTNQLKFESEDAVALVKNGRTLTLTGDDGVLPGTENHGILQFEQGATVVGNFGSTKAIKEFKLGTGVVALQGNNTNAATLNSKAQRFTFNNAASTLNITTVADQVLTGSFENASGNDNTGIIRFNQDAELVGTVGQGTANGSLANIQFDANKTLTVAGPGIWAETITPGNGIAGQGTLLIEGERLNAGHGLPAGTFTLNASTSTNGADQKLNALNIGETQVNGAANIRTDVTLDGIVRATAVNLIGAFDHKLTLADNAQLIGVTTFNNAGQELILNEGSQHTGNLVAAGGAGRGKIYVKGDSTITAQNAGIAANALNAIIFDTDGKTLTRTRAGNTETATANGVDFQADGTLSFTGAFGHTLNSAVNVNAGAPEGRGTIHFANNVTASKIVGAIGDTGDDQQRLKLLHNASAASITLDNNTHVNVYQFGANSELILNKNAAIVAPATVTYRFDHFDSGENQAIGKLHFNDDLIIRTASYGDETSEFKKTLLSEISFLGNHNVTVAEDSLLRANVLKTGGNNGTIIFAGNAVFDAAIETGGNTLRAITVNGAVGTTVDYRQNVSLDAAAGDISFANGGTFMFSGQNLTAHEINKAGGATNGKLKLARVGNQQDINADITADVDVEFAGGNVVLNAANTSDSRNYTFSSAEAMSVNLQNSANVGKAAFTVGANVDAVHTVKFDQDGLTFESANLGGDKALIFEGGNNVTTINVATTAGSQAAQFTSTRKDTAVLEFTRPGNQSSTISSVGTESNPFAFIRANAADGVIEGAAWTNRVEIADNRTLTFNGAVGVGTDDDQEIRLQGENARVVFGGEGLVLRHELVNTSDTNRGLASFGDRNVTVEGLIGTANKRLREVSFTFAEDSEKAATLNNDIHAQDVKFTRGAYNIGNVNSTGGIKLNGNFTASAAKLNLGTNSLQSSGGNAVFDGANMLNTSYNGTVGGSFTNADNNLRFNDGASLAVEINDVTVGIPREDASFTVLKNNGNALNDAAKAAIASAAGNLSTTGNASAKWVAEVDASGNLVLMRTNNAQVRLSEIAAEQGVADVNSRGVLNLLVAAPAGTAAGNTADELNDLATNDKAKFAEAVQRLSTNVDSAINDALEHAVSLVSGRLVSGSLPLVSGPDLQVESVASEGLGVAAGDDHDRYGIWATPFFSNANQKARKGAPGYKGDAYGLTAGFDTKVNDDMVIGLAATYGSSDVKHKDSKRGDKTKIESYMFSVYGSQQLTTNWFLSGIATVASNQVKNSSLRVTPTGNQVARGKYSSMSFSGELLAGYNYAMNGFALTPMAGFRYSRVNDGGYKESGTTNQNLDISKKASDKFDAIAGLRLSGSAYDMQGLSVTPEAHVFVHHDLINKNPNVSVKIDGVSGNLPQTSAKSARTFYNAGLGATAKYGMMEYGATYDANFGNKLVSHQGTLKVRVNF